MNLYDIENDADFQENDSFQEYPSTARLGMPSFLVFDWIRSVALAVFVVIFVLTFFFRIVNVDGRSMNNTLAHGDKLFVTSFLYTPEKNDIVVISHGQHLDEPIVKRVIATEGDTLKIDFKKNKVYVNGELQKEPYVCSELVKGDAVIPTVIPQGKIFVMGDNRKDSLDSRYNKVGLIDTGDVIGKVQYIFYPFDHAKYLY
ncbi:MAG: signal peptidase I [Oscillospiraceae bacterium]|nr:signal peptidase I [Oscillospiraceae bacterium]